MRVVFISCHFVKQKNTLYVRTIKNVTEFRGGNSFSYLEAQKGSCVQSYTTSDRAETSDGVSPFPVPLCPLPDCILT